MLLIWLTQDGPDTINILILNANFNIDFYLLSLMALGWLLELVPGQNQQFSIVTEAQLLALRVGVKYSFGILCISFL